MNTDKKKEILENVICTSVVDYALEHYLKDVVYILKGEEENLKKRYPDTYENILSCRYHRDRRTPLEYALDLVLGWIMEDFLVESLIDNGMDVKLTGTDIKRQILPASEVTAKPDIIIGVNGKTYIFDVLQDYTGFWTKTGKCHLRDDKFQSIVSKNNSDTKSGVIGIDLLNKKCFIKLLNSNTQDVKYIYRHRPYGYKPAYEITVSEFIPLDYNYIKERIINIENT